VPAGELGRPQARSPAGAIALVAVAGAATLAEAWALALPVLRAAGAAPPRPGAEPGLLPLLLLAGFALAVAVGLLALALAAVHALGRLPDQPARTAARRRRAARGAAAGLLAAAAVAVAAGAPAPRAGSAPLREALLLLALPAGAALALRAARRERRRRAADLAAVLAWDRARTAALAVRAARLEQLAWAEEALQLAARRRTGAQRLLEELRRRAQAAARLLARAAARERRRRHRVSLSLLGALERDRYAYLRQAAAQGREELASGGRGRVLETRETREPRQGPDEHGAGAGRVAI
jgi:hypothetical protein